MATGESENRIVDALGEQSFKVKELERFVQEQFQKEVSPERKQELNRELASVIDFFRGAGIQPYVAGGTGLDLLDGEWGRDHQDFDLAIMGSHRQAFVEKAMEAGFTLVDAHQKPLSAEDIKNPETENAFASGSSAEGTIQFEVIFLKETPTGDLTLGRATVSKVDYEQAPKKIITGREVVLQPPEIIVFHKLMDGRRKDFLDVKKVWDSFSADSKAKLQSYLENTHTHFLIEGKDVSDVPTLMQMAQQAAERKHREFFSKTVGQLIETANQELMDRCDEVFEIRKQSTDRASFLENVGEKAHGEHRVFFEAMADMLFSVSAPTLDQFKQWAKKQVSLEDRTKEVALLKYGEDLLWESSHWHDQNEQI